MTFQSRDVSESRFMYDQLAGLAPIMLALTAATPCFKVEKRAACNRPQTLPLRGARQQPSRLSAEHVAPCPLQFVSQNASFF